MAQLLLEMMMDSPGAVALAAVLFGNVLLKRIPNLVLLFAAPFALLGSKSMKRAARHLIKVTRTTR